MMEEIDRFQVPPVNGETQPLVRDEKTKTQSYANNYSECKQLRFICIACGFIVSAV